VKALNPARTGRRVGGLGLRSSERSGGWSVVVAGSSTGEMGETGEGARAASRSSAEFQELREEVERLLFLRRREAFREENMLVDVGLGVERRVIPGRETGGWGWIALECLLELLSDVRPVLKWELSTKLKGPWP
jgi:hypothetical protein